MADQSSRVSKIPPAFVAVAAWLVPGAGYLLIKDNVRGLTIGITILALFFSGLWVAGIRCLDVPGYKGGLRTYSFLTRSGEQVVTGNVDGSYPNGAADIGWTLYKRPLDEIRAKPWSIPQIMVGPLDLLCDWWAIAVSRPADPASLSGAPIGARSHSHVNELGVLYTAIAGMLNLLAIIDSSHRANLSEDA